MIARAPASKSLKMRALKADLEELNKTCTRVFIKPKQILNNGQYQSKFHSDFESSLSQNNLLETESPINLISQKT